MIFEIPGKPVGKGRPRFGNGHVYTPAGTVMYERDVAWRYKAAGGRLLDGPVEVSVTAIYKIPKSATRETRALIATGVIQPIVKPDVDNLAKAILDGLNGVAYPDDKQVTRMRVVKLYGEETKVIVEVGPATKQEGAQNAGG